MSNLRIVYFGGPCGHVGGASGEVEHAIRLWRKHGVHVTIVPTWGTVGSGTVMFAAETGCKVAESTPSKIHRLEGIADSIAVSCCNEMFFNASKRLRELCPVVWMPAMCHAKLRDKDYIKNGPFSAVVFQSHYQQSSIQPVYRKLGQPDDTTHVIRGAFDWDTVQWEPVKRRERFVGCRIARAGIAKWNADMWKCLSDVPNLKFHALGANTKILRKIGNPPKYARVYDPGSRKPSDLYRQSHFMLAMNGGDHENWPRVGLEAAAHGVAVVAENQWGWKEMFDESSAILYADQSELTEGIRRLESDEEFRMTIMRNARDRLEQHVCNSDEITDQWLKLFGSLL